MYEPSDMSMYVILAQPTIRKRKNVSTNMPWLNASNAEITAAKVVFGE